MKFKRIIGRLDIKGPNLVKGIHLEGLRVIGNPETFAESYYKEGIDELIYQDVVASLYGRNSLLDIIKKTAQNISIPLSVGGGIRSIEDIKKILNSGADKIIINTIATKEPNFINQASRIFGASTIVVALEVLKSKNKKYYAYTDNGREFTGLEAISWAREVEKRGAGEIFLTSIDQEGTGSGFDIDLIKKIANSVKIPVIAHGGAGNFNHIKNLLIDTKVDGAALASIFHYDYFFKLKKKMNFNIEGNKNFINNFVDNKKKKISISSLKKFLKKNYINVRI